MKKIRINVLARELEVKSHLILELLPDLGVSEKLTHSSSIDEDVADKLRVKFGLEPIGNGDGSSSNHNDADGADGAEGADGGVAVEDEPEQAPAEHGLEPAASHEIPQESRPEQAAAELPVAEAPVRISPPIRPPIAAPA